MASPLYLTLLAGPVEAVPVPKPVMDAFASAQVTESATGRSGFQLTFTLANDSPVARRCSWCHCCASSSSSPTAGCRRCSIDGVIEQYEVQPDAMSGSSKLVVTGHDLSALMDLLDLTGLPYPGLTPGPAGGDASSRGTRAFGIVPEVIPVPAPDVPVPGGEIPVQHGTDLAYINSSPTTAGYVFYLAPGPVPGTSQGYFGPQVRIGVPQPALSVNMDAWTNVESLTFSYQPLGSVAPIVYIATPSTGVAVPVPIPPVTPFNPPLGAFVPPPQKVPRADYGTAKLSPPRRLMLGMAEAVRQRRRRHRERHPGRRPVRRGAAGPQPGRGARRRDRVRRHALRGQRHARPQARRVQAVLHAQAQRPDRQPAGGPGPPLLTAGARSPMPDDKKFYGKYRGTVLDNVDPLQTGRLLVQVPDVAGVLPSTWALPCLPFAGPRLGVLRGPDDRLDRLGRVRAGRPGLAGLDRLLLGTSAEVPRLALAGAAGVQQVVDADRGPRTR